ncbi:VOC family protein [Oricola cellulosilytica]|uniref:VOC family protein n=1 Tax=Oricola cellulosilytica TaxID=1429082 RepID=A0A4R0PBE2_9HYPH|nr:VOC family protein [Oricola cellulosilytica]TCD13732.1 VOC family protein [Oricola cellulosilytica]
MSNPMQTHGAPSWIQHQGSDPAAARKFYETVLDWHVNDMPMGDGSSYPAIVVGDTPVGGFYPQPAEEGAWTVYITVDNVDVRFKKAVDAGATPVTEPTSMPGVGRMATIRDPQGGSLALITYESQQ